MDILPQPRIHFRVLFIYLWLFSRYNEYPFMLKSSCSLVDTGSLPSMLAFGEHWGSGSGGSRPLWHSAPTLALGWIWYLWLMGARANTRTCNRIEGQCFQVKKIIVKKIEKCIVCLLRRHQEPGQPVFLSQPYSVKTSGSLICALLQINVLCFYRHLAEDGYPTVSKPICPWIVQSTEIN